MRYVLIPSAKYVPMELNSFGRVPMVLFPINGTTILGRLYEKYESCDKIIVSALEGNEMLLKYQELFPKLSICVLKSTHNLTQTISSSLEKMVFLDGDELIINFGDTLVDNQICGDTIVYSNSLDLENRWTYLKEKDGVIIDILDKTISNEKSKDCKLVCGVISISDPCFLKQLLLENKNKGSSIFDILLEYSKKNKFVFEPAVNWYDAGHTREYYDSSAAIKSRVFNHIVIDKNRGVLKKTSDNVDKFKNEIEWYINIPKELSYVAPRVINHSLDAKSPFVEMEYYPYPTLLELSLYGNLDSFVWESVFEKIKLILNDFRHFRFDGEFDSKELYEMYIVKTIQRLNEMKTNSNFSSFFYNKVVINGVIYKSLDCIIEMINEQSFLEKLCNDTFFCIIHGDLCFANILIDASNNIIKLIDPRGSFGELKLYGDPCYDLAKLFHSMDGKYDYIIKDLFTININGNKIDLSFPTYNPKIFEIFKNVMKDNISKKLDKIEIIEGLLFLSMLPLHKENIRHQYAMLATGIEILSRHLDLKGD